MKQATWPPSRFPESIHVYDSVERIAFQKMQKPRSRHRTGFPDTPKRATFQWPTRVGHIVLCRIVSWSRGKSFENRSSGSGAQTSPVQPRNTENSTSSEDLVLRGREVETERRTWLHRRISGKRAVDEETTSSVKKERIASSDLSLIRSPPESPLPPSDDAMVRFRDKRQSENRSDEQSKRVARGGAGCGSLVGSFW